ncbi:MAG: hypothetical protein ACOY33_09090 [Pseudomonadota bacterium]
MNANNERGLTERINAAGLHVARRFPLTVRTIDLLLVSILYVLGLVAVDQLTGASYLPVMVFAMFAMPVVLSVGLRLYRGIARRLGLFHEAGPLAQAG